MTKLFERLKDLLAVMLFATATSTLTRFSFGLRLDLSLFLAPGVIQDRYFEFFSHKRFRKPSPGQVREPRSRLAACCLRPAAPNTRLLASDCRAQFPLPCVPYPLSGAFFPPWEQTFPELHSSLQVRWHRP